LVDAGVWIDHLRRSNDELSRLLDSRRVLTHPCVIGELALCSLHRRERFLGEIAALPLAAVATDWEVHQLIEWHPLFGRAIGYVDAHLLAAARLTNGATLWTRDKRLRDVASELRIAWSGG
jgi:hypothetical protein